MAEQRGWGQRRALGQLASDRLVNCLSSAVKVALVSLGLGLSGCQTLGLSQLLGTTDEAMTTQSLVRRPFRANDLSSNMLPVRLRLGSGWQPAPSGSLHNRADLEAYNPDAVMYLVVLGEPHSAVDDRPLEDQATAYIRLLQQGLDRTTNGETQTGVQEVNGFPAVQYQVQGEVLGRSVAYLHTTVDMDDHYYQVVVWTPEDRFSANADAMEAMVQGLASDSTNESTNN
jgi:hypothetical protein